MAPQTSVDTDGMAQAVNAFEGTVADLQGQMRTADGSIGTLQAAWQSDTAAPRFQAAISEWRTNGDAIVNDLNRMSEMLGQTNLGYTRIIDSTDDIAGGVQGSSRPGLPL